MIFFEISTFFQESLYNNPKPLYSPLLKERENLPKPSPKNKNNTLPIGMGQKIPYIKSVLFCQSIY